MSLRLAFASALPAALLASACAQQPPPAHIRKQLIAHRGASGYAPEHTLAAYQMALEQGADFVEPDLAVSKDGRLICLHDDSLERTTNVAALFPDRYHQDIPAEADAGAQAVAAAGTRQGGTRHWLANDFTLDEIKQLDAGSWMSDAYRGAKVPTWDEIVQLVRGKAGLYPELKSPPLYTARGVDMVQIFVDSMKKYGLDTVESLKRTPVIVQSFDEATVRRVAKALPDVPRVFLTSRDQDVTDARLRSLAEFATGIAPEKGVIARHPDLVARAHALHLTVTAWTFRVDEQTTYASVNDEMAQFLYGWDIDALFTNHPDQFPRR